MQVIEGFGTQKDKNLPFWLVFKLIKDLKDIPNLFMVCLIFVISDITMTP